MKKILIIISTVMFAVLIFTAVLYVAYLHSVGGVYAEKYSEVFGSYEIDKVDNFLDNNTILYFKGESKTYAELRKNVIKAFDEKIYSMPQISSYGSAYGKFANYVQEVGICTFGDYKGRFFEGVIMEIERTSLFSFSFRVKSLKSNDKFFGYLFFGINE